MEILQCFKLFISKNGQKNNIGSDIILTLLIINIICIIHTLLSTCINKYKELISKYKNYNGKTIFDLKKIKDLNSKNLSLNSLTKEQTEIIDNFCEYIKSINNINRNNNTSESDVKIYNSKKSNINNNDKIYEIKEEVIEKLNNGELEDYYSCVLYIFKENYQKHITEDELNGLDYEDYKKMEKRNFCKIMWSLFKTNYDFFSTFFMFHHEDYKIYSIKVMAYINTLLLSLVINISFYTDDTMHKIYIDNGDKDIILIVPLFLKLIILFNFQFFKGNEHIFKVGLV